MTFSQVEYDNEKGLWWISEVIVGFLALISHSICEVMTYWIFIAQQGGISFRFFSICGIDLFCLIHTEMYKHKTLTHEFRHHWFSVGVSDLLCI